MPNFRATVRYGSPQRYHVLDLAAPDLAAALAMAAEQLPEDVARTADLVEVRVQAHPDERIYSPG